METREHSTIADFITSQEAAYRQPVPINDTYSWSMPEHIKTTVNYKNSQLNTGNPGGLKPVKNITRPILNVQYRAEGFDVKDIVLYVNSAKDYYKSFLVKKYHEMWARENNIDTFIDAMVESFVDFGGALVKYVNGKRPEIVPLQSIAFCDQTDILSGPIGIKHFYSPDQLLDMADLGWGNTSNGADTTLEVAIKLSREEKRTNGTNQETVRTPGKYVTVYEVHANMPVSFIDKADTSGTYSRQFFVGCMVTKQNGKKSFLTLFHMEEKESPLRFIARDAIYGRALGFGGAEELFEPQVWVNLSMIRMQDMLESASKTILKASGANGAQIANKNKIRDLDNLSIIDVGPSGDLNQIDTFPRNIKLFEDAVAQWEAHAQQMGAANDSIMGQSPTAGTPFKLQELVTNESHSLHEYRKGKLATFLEQIYRESIIPNVVKDMHKGAEFLAELTLEELQEVKKALVTCETNDFAIKQVLAGTDVSQELLDGYKLIVEKTFTDKGSKHFIEIFEGEMKKVPLQVQANIAGKQKNLAGQVDKIVNIFRFAFSNPQGFAQVMQIPGMSKSFNEIIEFSGLSPVDFAGIEKLAVTPALPEQQAQQTLPQAAPQTL